MLTKSDLLKISEKEFATTLRVLRAFPTDQKDFKPHERSQDAVRLISTFVFEMYLLRAYLFGEKFDRATFQNYAPRDLASVIADFEKETSDFLQRFREFPEPDLIEGIEFGGRTFTKGEFALMMLFDQIHHRGQLTVYLRMAGGKVPSIYGPSADDTSTNL